MSEPLLLSPVGLFLLKERFCHEVPTIIGDKEQITYFRGMAHAAAMLFSIQSEEYRFFSEVRDLLWECYDK